MQTVRVVTILQALHHLCSMLSTLPSETLQPQLQQSLGTHLEWDARLLLDLSAGGAST